MYIIGNLLLGLVSVLDVVLFMAQIIVIASVVISWIDADPHNPIVRIIHNLTTPIYRTIQKKLPTSYGSMDFTPVIVLLIILFLQSGILPSLAQLGISMKV